MRMERYWVNLRTLRYRFNNLEYGPARTDAENWLEPLPGELGWFATAELMNDYIRSILLPALEEAWKANPQSRLGQLIFNAARDRDIYYVSDGEMVKFLKAQHA